MAIRKAALLSADRAHVLGAMAGFKNLKADQWLSVGHPAPQGEFSRAGWAAVSSLPNKKLVEAVAVAAPNHCIDGWSYASRATSALLAGDYHACRHLAYYAQLRAGLSMLANLGVGLFNRINFVVTKSGSIVRLDDPGKAPKLLGLGTHSVVWEALKTWAGDTVAARLFLDLVRIRGVSLRECLEAIWPGASSNVAAGLLIKSWGVDLARATKEHESRNASSYNPQLLTCLATPVKDSLALVGEIWQLCEPTTSGSFNNLDRYLLRSVLWAQHRKLKENRNYANGAIDKSYSLLSPRISSIASKDFLTGKSDEPDPQLLQHAQATASPAEPVAMLARAYLLLRTATAFTHSSFIDAGLDLPGGDMRAWVDEYAERRGFWRPGDPLPDPVDLYADVDLALYDFQDAMNSGPTSWFDWMAYSNRGMPHVAEMERIGVWSFSA